jgi:bifunctional non-homologous end joining protein LigD
MPVPPGEECPTWIAPMLAASSRSHRIDPSRYGVEPKWDGWRAFARINSDGLALRSRHRRCLLDSFPQLSTPPAQLAARSVILDGEIVAFNADGKPSFYDLGFGRGRRTSVAFVAFDVLYADGDLLIDQPYVTRRERLLELALNAWPWLTTPAAATIDDAGDLWGTTRDLGLEGVVAKRLDAPYQPGRRAASWLKLKHPHARDLQLEPDTTRQVSASRRPPLPAIAYD